ncbi:MAG: hypothetical protein O2968_06665, partial [Acidobacteria bacterium]|nr:hypothetical protein [Acidobacteriota bacterium]
MMHPIASIAAASCSERAAQGDPRGATQHSSEIDDELLSGRWRDLHFRELSRKNGRQLTENIRVDIVVEGVSSLWWKSHIETRVDKLVLWQW